MYSESVMDTELHEVCISARRFLHQSFNDLPVDRAYLFRMDTKFEAGRRIREARDKLGLKLRDVEEAIPEISVSRLSNWEQGINMIGVDEAKPLCAGGPDLPCNMQWLTIEAHKSKTREDLRSCLVEIHR